MKLYPVARVQVFTYETIYNAWKATSLLPFNPIAVLKTLLYIEDFTGLKIDPLITNTSLQPLKTPKTMKDLKFLWNQITKSTTSRPDNMLESPTQQRLKKLFKATIGFATNAHIQREENKKFQKFKIDKKSSKRLLSKGRVFTQDNVNKLKVEDLAQ